MARGNLKQPCVHLLQVTASLTVNPSSARKDLSHALTNLLGALHSITATPGLLDPRLAEYAFVPLSQLLRVSRHVPVRAMELCLECISALLSARWGGHLEPALSGQLLILFTFLAKPSSAENGIAATSEELQALALRCTAQLLTEASRTEQAKQAVIATANIPALAEAVLVMLDSLTDSKSNAVRLQAVAALKALNDAIPDDDALAGFFPKLVSSLTKLLTPNSSNRPGFRIVEQCLGLLCSLLQRLLSDQKTENLPENAPIEISATSSTVSRSTSWLRATASQVKIALANVFKLRDHDKPEVRTALLQLCLCILQDCRTSLSACASMAIEAIISITDHGDSQGTARNKLKVLLSTDQYLSELLHESLYGWVVSLPRLMQSKDDHSRHRIIHQVSAALRLFEQNSTTLDERIAASLCEGISVIFLESKGLQELPEDISDNPLHATLTRRSTQTAVFQSLKLHFKSQDNTMAEFKLLIQELARSDSALTVAQELVRRIDVGPLEMRISSFWASVNMIRDITMENSPFDDYVDIGMPNLREALLDDLYFHSLAILNQSAPITNTPWQMFALALETVALQALRYQSDFRAELSEVLYPVLQHLAGSNSALRGHALTCLNMISAASGYSNVGDLVVANVDYIVNAIGLKLAVGDVSPQAPQVLLMMMQLCGPSLLPYLDDLIGSIFDALERYHAYSKLSELLFLVLRGVAEEGVQAPQLALISGDSQAPEQQSKKVTTMCEMDETETGLPKGAFPQKPWKASPIAEAEDQSDLTDEGQRPIDTQNEDLPPPAPRTFNILLKISNLTQYYLTTTSPNLRSSLLSLLRTTIPTLAKHENSFLPLINTLWPVLLPRLQDPEAYVVCSALDVVALICKYAQNFMRTRIEDAWDLIKGVHRRTRYQVQDRNTGANDLISMSLDISDVGIGMAKLSMDTHSSVDTIQPEKYIDAPTRMIWKSLVRVLCAISEHVTLREDRFDELMYILDPIIESEEVQQALEHGNSDALWLWLYKKSKRSLTVKHSDCRSVETFASTIRVPARKPHWHFVDI
ncbi:armadillo-type protein [Pyrenochaeta sp. MPI-SDFR-AT-0127]|nr:armadillo-type protein [Pyrenochaeta sp. MPI-SDFR-AT-0127]